MKIYNLLIITKIFKFCKKNELLLTDKRYLLILKPDLRTWMRRR